MEREIKFRVWNNQKMIYETEYMSIGQILYEGKWAIMQYTGLKDHDKKEIYDKDILKDISGYLWLVFWYDDHACFGLKAIGQENVTVEIIDNHNMKLVGNFYENPELLK